MPCWFHKQFRKWVLWGFCLAELVRSRWRFSLGVHELDHLVHWQKETERKGPPASQPAPPNLPCTFEKTKTKNRAFLKPNTESYYFNLFCLLGKMCSEMFDSCVPPKPVLRWFIPACCQWFLCISFWDVHWDILTSSFILCASLRQTSKIPWSMAPWTKRRCALELKVSLTTTIFVK